MSGRFRPRPRLRHVGDGVPLAPLAFRNRYDDKSGQVFDETVCGVPSSAERLWQYRTLGDGCVSYRCGVGPPSLQDTALRSVVRNIAGFTADTLREVPWKIGEKMWELVLHLDLDSLHTWQAFASVWACEGVESLLYHRCSITSPSLPLDGYTTPIASPSFQWITLLSISTTSISRTELVNLSTLTNLGALDLTDPSPSTVTTPAVGDSLVRSWSRAVTESGAFSRLRVLVLRNHADVTARSLQYLSVFPTLVLLDASGCDVRQGDEACALPAGWTCTVKREKGTAGSSWDDPLRERFQSAGQVQSARGVVTGLEAALPVLNFRIGPAASDGCRSGRGLMLHFQRQRSPGAPVQPCLKRSTDESSLHPQASVRTAKKRRVPKKGKQQSFEDVLRGFGGF
ncbi:MAG: hypothetical protein M1832_003470 [Thelocarpon impressellum]|nr:MAG: hypothetical protein M1832_003470 [Thelocarpon impressellum]